MHKVLIFLHIPKCGGTTVNRALRLRFLSSLEIIREGLAPRLLSRGDLESVAEEASRSTWHRKASGWAYFKGRHMAYGADAMIEVESEYLTILRNPIDWVVSAYHFSKRPEEPDITLEEFVSSGRSGNRFYTAYSDNIMTRMLCGKRGHPDLRPIGSCDQAMLDKAVARLKAMIGGPLVLERLDESFLCLFRETGWKPIQYLTSNVNRKRPARSALTDDQRQMIEAANPLDLELYRLANDWLSSAIERYGDSFEADLEAYRRRQEGFQARWTPLNRWFTQLRDLQLKCSKRLRRS